VKLTQDRLQKLAASCWGEVTRFLKPDSCVIATRVFADALSTLGHRADGMAMQATILSPAAVQHAQEHDCLRRIPDCPERGDRALAVLGWDPDAPARGFMESWSGHVVAVVRRQWLIDLSLPQVHRPELGLNIDAPLVVDLPPEFFKGGKTVELHEESGMWLLYHALPNAKDDWRESPDWAWNSLLRTELVRGTLARYNDREYRYPDNLQRIFALTGKV
jgi:hypothetical protein